MSKKDKKPVQPKISDTIMPDEIAEGTAMDHIIIRISDGKTKKEILNKRG